MPTTTTTDPTTDELRAELATAHAEVERLRNMMRALGDTISTLAEPAPPVDAYGDPIEPAPRPVARRR